MAGGLTHLAGTKPTSRPRCASLASRRAFGAGRPRAPHALLIVPVNCVAAGRRGPALQRVQGTSAARRLTARSRWFTQAPGAPAGVAEATAELIRREVRLGWRGESSS